MALDPRLRGAAAGLVWGGGGYLLSAGGLGAYPQPVVLGMICGATGWRVVLMTLGAMVGYPAFWGMAGLPGIVWSAAGGLLTMLLGKRERSREQPLMLPVLAAFLTAVTELCFCLLLKDETPFLIRCLRVMLTLVAAMVFLQASRCRDPITDWLAGAFMVLAVARVRLGPFGLGYIAAGALGSGGPFPAAVLAGLSLDLARLTQLPMAAVLCLSWFLRLLPWEKRWQQALAPPVAWLLVSAACGSWDREILPGLALGSGLGLLLPRQPSLGRRRGQTGAAQVRLELGARAMTRVQQMLTEQEVPPIDENALVEKARQRACGGCAFRKNCQTSRSLSQAHLRDPLDADCKKQGRLIAELRRSREQLKLMQADRQRRWEYRTALIRQYEGMSDYLRLLADRLPRQQSRARPVFRIEAGARSRGKERANGDSCIAFPGMACCYYILLCDGMGTGLGAAEEGSTASKLLQQLLTAGIPAEHALGTLNSLLALRGSAGAVTVDLTEIHLDTGLAEIYKWGACPSYLLTRSGTEKIGTASPPPGISVGKIRREREKLSLRRGEVLILLSDGVDGEVVQSRHDLSPDLPPGELAAKLLESGCGSGEDDATVTAIRLRPISLATS
ncbi:MAG: SpoIIE family protein phosphatase [Oscillospiraceae bacterium]|nr:SpoIIE family protein phosphatase [Oscillospiraceae bacterium]